MRYVENLQASRQDGADYLEGHPIEPLTEAEKAAITQRLDQRLTQARRASQIPRVTENKHVQGGAIAVAETNLPLPKQAFMATSPNVHTLFDRADESYHTFKPATDFPQAQNHAEQGLVGKIHQALKAANWTTRQMLGYSVFMHIEQKVCFNCSLGLNDVTTPTNNSERAIEYKRAGVLKKFSLTYPSLAIEITNQQDDEIIHIMAGKRVQ